MLVESPDDPILDELRDVRTLDRAGQVAIAHLRADHPEQLAKAVQFATSVTKYYALSGLLPINAHAPMFVSGMEKLRVNLGAMFVPEQAPPSADPSSIPLEGPS